MVLNNIEEFYNTFWEDRANKVLSKQQVRQIQSMTSLLLDDIRFKLYYADASQNGYSNKSHTIFINGNNETNIPILIMHEFGHIQYNQKEFIPVVKYNDFIINNPLPIEKLSELDYKYFTNKNEIRQRLIPLVKLKLENDLTYKFIFNNFEDDLFQIYDKKDLIYWMNNIL